MVSVRAVGELRDVDDPAWPHIAQALRGAASPVTIVEVEPARGAAVLYRLQVTARSSLGALALNCGGLIVDDGWLRLLGGGGDRLLDLAAANGLGDPMDRTTSPGSMLVALDALGGQFAIDGGDLQIGPGEVCYLAPDTLAWEGTGLLHGDFVVWALGTGLEEFYADLRWPGWRTEVASLTYDSGLSMYPPLCAEGPAIGERARAPVALSELHGVLNELAAQLTEVTAGSEFRVVIVP